MQKLKFLGGMTGAFEPTVVAAFPKNDVKVLKAQCPIPDDLAFVARRRKRPCPLLIGQKYTELR
jgi:hypothetical protein